MIERKARFTWRDLPEEEARALNKAWLPGFERLREAEVDYDVQA